MYSTDIEDKLGCKELIDELERMFDAFSQKKEWEDPLDLLKEIKRFLYKKMEPRENLLRKSKLSGSDCLTLSTLAAIIARRKGVNAEVAVPRRLTRLLHALVVYSVGSRKMAFTIAGRGTYQNARPVSQKEIRMRLRLTKPVVNLANRLRGPRK